LKRIIKQNKGLTLIELLITLLLVSVVTVLSTFMFINIRNIQVKGIVRKEIQEELYVLMEKIVQDVKNNTLDYRGYYVYNGAYAALGENARYGGDSLTTSNKSYINIPVAFPTGGNVALPAPNFFNNGNPAEEIKSEEILLLLDNTGKKRIKYTIMDPDDTGELTMALMKSEQIYSNDTTNTCHSFPELNPANTSDLSVNGSQDWNPLFTNPDFCWTLDEGYDILNNQGYIPISSPNIEITYLRFYFHVHKSPFKVYEEDEVQLHPMVTILLSGRHKESDSVVGTIPELSLQTTISSRNYDEIEWSTL